MMSTYLVPDLCEICHEWQDDGVEHYLNNHIDSDIPRSIVVNSVLSQEGRCPICFEFSDDPLYHIVRVHENSTADDDDSTDRPDDDNSTDRPDRGNSTDRPDHDNFTDRPDREGEEVGDGQVGDGQVGDGQVGDGQVGDGQAGDDQVGQCVWCAYETVGSGPFYVSAHIHSCTVRLFANFAVDHPSLPLGTLPCVQPGARSRRAILLYSWRITLGV